MMLVIQHVILWSAFLLSVSNARWSLPVLAFFLPFTQWLPDIPIPGLNALNLLLLPALARAFAKGPEPGPARGDPLTIPAAIFVVFVLISWLRVQFQDLLPALFIETGGLWGNFVTLKEILMFAAFYFCARRLGRDPEDFRRTVVALFGAFVFEALTAAKEFLIGAAWRATGHLGQPNKLGAFLSGYVMIPIGFLMSGAGKYFIPCVVAVSLAVFGLFGAVSRGALLALGGAVLMIAIIKRSGWIIIISLALGTSPYWLPEKVMDRFVTSVETDEFTGEVEFDTEKEGRVQIWECGQLMIADNPIFGVGLGMFPFNLRAYGYTHRLLKTSHNLYIQLSAEQGLPAVVAHISMMLVFFVCGLRVAFRHGHEFEGKFALGFAGTTLAFFLSNTTGDGFYENNLSGMYWILGGLVINLHRGLGFQRPENQPEDSK